MDWRKSSHSGANGGSCVEVAGAARVVLVRDTTDRDGRTLAFTAEAWRAFAEELKRLVVWPVSSSGVQIRLPGRGARSCRARRSGVAGR
jgi:hypothetical protein